MGFMDRIKQSIGKAEGPQPSAAQMDCTYCGYRNSVNNRFCEECGQPLDATAPVSFAYCPRCNGKNPLEQIFCSHCGASTSDIDVKSPPVALTMGTIPCGSCGGFSEANSSFCTSCGAHLPETGGVTEAPMELPAEKLRPIISPELNPAEERRDRPDELERLEMVNRYMRKQPEL